MEDRELTAIVEGRYCKTHKVLHNEEDGRCEKCILSEKPWMPEYTKNVKDFKPASMVAKYDSFTISVWAIVLSIGIWIAVAYWLFSGDDSSVSSLQ